MSFEYSLLGPLTLINRVDTRNEKDNTVVFDCKKIVVPGYMTDVSIDVVNEIFNLLKNEEFTNVSEVVSDSFTYTKKITAKKYELTIREVSSGSTR